MLMLVTFDTHLELFLSYSPLLPVSAPIFNQEIMECLDISNTMRKKKFIAVKLYITIQWQP
jgi:hypothetical protein